MSRLFYYNWQWRRPVVRIPLLVNLLLVKTFLLLDVLVNKAFK
ncbi:hypothetical protein T4A_12512 [Trichinella pseudospiralis]|uniref:Uncharacterized protein n=1 Tax=Trichinella pseudospiralis TaxID=6337 RepID=A0A0V1DQE8_TRIPS|nr:hypothetical protein T4A_12512 [Trichinella pseudospiralis]